MSHLEEGVLHALLDGEIPSTELPPIQAHLAGCAECRVSLDEARALRGEVEALVEVIQVSEAMAGAAASRKRPTQGPAWGRRLAWAASVVLAAGLGYAVRPAGTVPERSAALAESRPALPSDQSAAAPPPEPATPAPERAASAPGGKESGFRRAAPNRTPPRETRALAQVEKKPAPSMADSIVAAGAASGRAAANAAVPSPPAAFAATAARERAAGAVPASPPATRPAVAGELSGGLSRSLKQSLRLEELVVTSPQEPRDMAKPVIPVTVIQFPEAVGRLGGTLRLVEGLVPLRIETQGSVVRVIYPADRGELILAQWLSDGRLIWTLSGPPEFPADSLDRLRVRVRE